MCSLAVFLSISTVTKESSCSQAHIPRCLVHHLLSSMSKIAYKTILRLEAQLYSWLAGPLDRVIQVVRKIRTDQL